MADGGQGSGGPDPVWARPTVTDPWRRDADGPAESDAPGAPDASGATGAPQAPEAPGASGDTEGAAAEPAAAGERLAGPPEPQTKPRPWDPRPAGQPPAPQPAPWETPAAPAPGWASPSGPAVAPPPPPAPPTAWNAARPADQGPPPPPPTGWNAARPADQGTAPRPSGAQPYDPTRTYEQGSTQPMQAPAPPPGGAPAPPAGGPWSADLGPYGDRPQPGPGQPPQGFGGYPPAPPGPYPVASPQPRAGGHRRTALVALVLGACLLCGLVGGIVGGAIGDGQMAGSRPTVDLPDVPPANTSRSSGSVAGVAQAVLQSVVAIQVRNGQEGGTGSGFVIDAKGYILTNNHVVAAGDAGNANSEIQVVFQDGTQVDGTIVGRDPSYDLAVIKVEADGLKALQLGNSDGVVVGDPVIAIGAPLGLQGTVTTGIVSAKNRPVAAGDDNQPAFINAIQTDAAINPGNSGGPLVDSQGRVIGVNSAIARVPGTLGTTGGSIGLGFSIPSNQAQRTADQLIKTGKAVHPIIGVVLDRNYQGEGVRVSTQNSGTTPAVTPDGPADKAGIKPGDVIVEFNGRPVTEPDELIVAIRAQTPGDTVTLTLRQGSSERDVKVSLGAAE